MIKQEIKKLLQTLYDDTKHWKIQWSVQKNGPNIKDGPYSYQNISIDYWRIGGGECGTAYYLSIDDDEISGEIGICNYFRLKRLTKLVVKRCREKEMCGLVNSVLSIIYKRKPNSD